MSFNRDGKMNRLDSTGSSASTAQAKAKASLPKLVTFSEDDVKNLQKKREKEGWCPLCGEVRTHKKCVMRMIPETVHGLVYQGVCLRCNPTPNLINFGLTYGIAPGWVRTIRATDFKFRWERSLKSDSYLDTAHVRKVELFGGVDAICTGLVSLVSPEDCVVDSMVESNDGRTVVSFSDIERAQKMDPESKKQWFHEACDRFSRDCEGQERIFVRQNHFLQDSMDAVMQLSQAEMRKTWTFERERKHGKLSPQEWYKSIIEKILCTETGLWQKCSLDETRVEINLHSGMACIDHSKYFRFLGRILGKALFDGQPLNFKLAKHIYMLILGWPIVLDDLKDLDVRYHSYLRSLKRLYLLPKYDNHRVAQEASLMAGGSGRVSSLGLHFTVSEVNLNGLRTKVPLVPNGSSIAVDEENLSEYIDSCFKYRMFGRCQVQLNELLLGVFEVVPEPLLTVFDYQELEAIMCGSSYSALSSQAQNSFSGGNSRQTDVGGQQPMNAIVRAVSCSSSPSDVPVAFLIDDDLYDAVAEPVVPVVDNNVTLNASEVSYRLKKGQCPTCGTQTHKLTGVLKKHSRPLFNDQVLNGRCLLCNPIEARVQESNEMAPPITNLPPPIAPPSDLRSEEEDKQPHALEATNKTMRHDSTSCFYDVTALSIALDQFPTTEPSVPSTTLTSFTFPPSPPSPPPTAPPIDSDTTNNVGEDLSYYGGKTECLQKAESNEEVEEWLLSRLPALHQHDVKKYCEHLIEDGFDSIAMMDHLEEDDFYFMKKAHRRALKKSL